jgi:tetratricopeptide (TPR) repeat protein
VIITALLGTAGVGKTALAVHWAHRLTRRFPDGQLYVNLRGFDPTGSVMSPAEAVRGFLAAFEVPASRIPTEFNAQIGMYRSLLAGRRVLVVLDNARDADQVRPLLPGAPGCLALITSRSQLISLVAAEGARALSLDVLTVEEARELLARRLDADRVATDPGAIDEIITRCARLPLALAVVAARAATRPYLQLAALADELRDSHDRLYALTTDDTATDVRSVLSWSYHTLTPAAAALFRLLGLHPGPDISLPATASLAGLARSDVRPLLAELTRAHLIVEQSPGRYTFHDLLRAYARQLADSIDSDERRRTASHRMLDHYLHTAYVAALLLDPTRDPITVAPAQPGVTPEHPVDHEQVMNWLDAEYAVLIAIIHDAAATGWDAQTWQLAWTLSTYLDRRGRWHTWIAVQHAAVLAARRSADPTAEALSHRNLARAHIQLLRYEDAHTHLQHALGLSIQAGDQAGQIHTHYMLGWIRGLQDLHAEAISHTEQALLLYRETGNRAGQARALNNIGWSYAQLADYQEALTYCQQSLTLQQELGDRYGEAGSWDSLGYAYHHLGQYDQGITCYQRALDLYRELADRHGEADAMARLGDCHQAAGQPDAARNVWQLTLDILDDLDHPNAAQIRTKLRQLDRAQP